MDPARLRERQDQVELVDVREAGEWNAGRIPGSRWIPMAELPQRLEELDRERPVVTVCRSGRRSGEMAGFLTEKGYQAENLEGGIEAWAERRYPVRTPDGEQPGTVA